VTIDIKKYQFPEMSDVDIAFSSLTTDKKLLAEAEARGFLHGNTPYNKLFNDLFFNGGKVEFKNDLDPEFRSRCIRYLRGFMGSFEPKHEHKEAICALLLSELVDTD
jgi:hypothetical protein